MPRAGALWIAVMVAGCGPEGPPPPPVTVTDSAGVRVVDVSGPLAGQRIRLSRRPAWQTGWEDDEPTFEQVRTGFILPDGGAVVGDNVSSRIYVIDRRGRVARTLGGKGQGPGEFTYLGAVAFLAPDTIVAADRGRRRAVLLTLAGEVGRSFDIPLGSPFSIMPSRVSSGRVLYSFESWSEDFRDRSPGWRWMEAPMVTSDLLGEEVDTVGRLPFVQRLWHDGIPSQRPFPAMGLYDTYEGGFAWAISDAPEVRWYDAAGALSQVTRWAPRWVKVTADVWSEYEAAMLSALKSSPEMAGREGRMRKMLAEQKKIATDVLPLFSWLYGGADGSVWLADFKMPFARTARFTVIGADGMPLGAVAFPDGFRVLDIAAPWVLGTWPDDLDVQSVALFRFDVVEAPAG